MSETEDVTEEPIEDPEESTEDVTEEPIEDPEEPIEDPEEPAEEPEEPVDPEEPPALTFAEIGARIRAQVLGESSSLPAKLAPDALAAAFDAAREETDGPLAHVAAGEL